MILSHADHAAWCQKAERLHCRAPEDLGSDEAGQMLCQIPSPRQAQQAVNLNSFSSTLFGTGGTGSAYMRQLPNSTAWEQEQDGPRPRTCEKLL